MACPRCGCKEHYQYDDGEDFGPGDEEWQRCAACGHIFHEYDGGYEYEDLTQNAKVSGAGTASAGLPGYAGDGNGERNG